MGVEVKALSQGIMPVQQILCTGKVARTAVSIHSIGVNDYSSKPPIFPEPHLGRVVRSGIESGNQVTDKSIVSMEQVIGRGKSYGKERFDREDYR